MSVWLGSASPSSSPLLAAGFEDGSVAVWDLAAGRCCSWLKIHDEPGGLLLLMLIIACSEHFFLYSHRHYY